MMSPSRKEDDMRTITRSTRQLLTDLRELTVDVERLEFREQFRNDEGMCATVVRRCADRLDRLSQHWPAVHGSLPKRAVS
jgi:hypothetical protein